MRIREMEMSMEMRQDPAPRADTHAAIGVMRHDVRRKTRHMKLANYK